MDMVTGWLVGIAVFVLGGVAVAALFSSVGRGKPEWAQEMEAGYTFKHSLLANRIDEMDRVWAEHDRDLDAQITAVDRALDEADDRAETQFTEAQARVESLVKRVVALEQRPQYDDSELRVEFGKKLAGSEAIAGNLLASIDTRIENLRKRTAEKFALRDAKILDLQKRVVDLEPAALAVKSTEHSTAPAEKKPSRKRNA